MSGILGNAFDGRRVHIRRVVEHKACATDQTLSWDARVWHAGMYEKLTGRRLHVYISAGVR